MHFPPEDQKKIKRALFIVTCSILIYNLIDHLPAIFTTFGHFLGIIAPFIYAIAIAFVINIPMSFFENKFLGRLPIKKSLQRVLAIILAYFMIIFLISLLFSIILPKLYTSSRTFILAIPDILDRLSHYIKQAHWLGRFQKILLDTLDQVKTTSISSYLMKKIGHGQTPTTLSPSLTAPLIETLTSIFSGFLNAFVALIFSIYMLASKERLTRQCKELVYSLLPEKAADSVMYIAYTAYDNFYNFFTGQFLEAIVLGGMTYSGMKILKMDYAIVIAIIVSFGALIPMVGAVLAGFVGTMILLSIDPVQGIGFLIFICVLQQFDGNLVYPKIVGQSVGLPAMWVLLGIIIGGSLFGVIGMFMFVPIMSTLYDLLTDFKTRRLAEKKINVSSK